MTLLPCGRPTSPAALIHCLVTIVLFTLAAPAAAVTTDGDVLPHQWHTAHAPENGFEGAVGERWARQDEAALYADWGGFIPDASGSWVFSTPTVGRTARTRAVLRETSGTGLLTAIGNIYGLAFGQVPGPPLVFELLLTDTEAAALPANATRTVVMQWATKGVLPALDVTLNGAVATSVATFRVDGTIDMPTGTGGAIEANATTDGEWLVYWRNVPASQPLQFAFRATVGHMSLDSLAVFASPASVTPGGGGSDAGGDGSAGNGNGTDALARTPRLVTNATAVLLGRRAATLAAP